MLLGQGAQAICGNTNYDQGQTEQIPNSHSHDSYEEEEEKEDKAPAHTTPS